MSPRRGRGSGRYVGQVAGDSDVLDRRQAEAAANDAQKYATQANGYANQAEQSAKDAAASAKTARNAQQTAENAAADALSSATAARRSANWAVSSAAAAWTSARKARDAATTAGKDAAAAAAAEIDAYQAVIVKQQQEMANRWKTYEEYLDKNNKDDDDNSWMPDWLKSTLNTVSPYAKAFWDNSPQILSGLAESLGGAFMADLGITEGVLGGGGGLVLCPETLGGGCLEAVVAVGGGIAVTGEGIQYASDGVHRFSDGLQNALREAQDEESVTIYKAPGKGMTDKLLKDGFTERDFPGSGNGYPDGRAYFGLEEDGKTIALDYASRGGYDNEVLQVRIPKADFDRYFAKYVGSHNGVPGSEVAIPNTDFDMLNQYPRSVVGE